jgi:hypothetical protein
MNKAGKVALVVLWALGVATVLVSCGGSDTDSASEQQLESARREGEEAARERAQVKSLQRQVRHLQKEVHGRQPKAVVVTGGDDGGSATESAASTASRTFHAPSGNVSCEVSSNGALCSIASSGETFVFANGEEARLESGAVLPRSAGELAPYGSTIEVGSVACSVPQSNESHGITCADGASGHGFEASRVPERQSTY